MNTMNFKKFEVTGATKAEALAKVSDVFSVNNDGNVKGDATQAYKNWHKSLVDTGTAVTDAMKKQFMADYLTKKKAIAGEAYFITIEKAVVDTRERPWTIDDIKNEDGKRKWKTQYVLVDEATGAPLGQCDTTKKEAKDLAKKIIAKGFKGAMRCEMRKEVVEGQPLAFKARYTPSAGSQPGVWVVFGIEKD